MRYEEIALDSGICKLEPDKITISPSLKGWKVIVDSSTQDITLEERVIGIPTLRKRYVSFSHVQRIDGACFEAASQPRGLCYTIDIVTIDGETIPIANTRERNLHRHHWNPMERHRYLKHDKDAIWKGERVVSALRKLIGLRDPSEPSVAEGYNQRGIKYAKVCNYDRAIAEFTEAINTYPFIGNLYYNRAMAFEELGRINEAIADYQKYIEIGDDARLIESAKESLNGLSG